MTAKDAFGAHARDELGFSGHGSAQPIQAALTSAVTFAAGAAIPLLVAAISPAQGLSMIVSVSSLVFFAVLGAVGARIGGAPALKPAIRVTFWGAIAMGLTAAIGALTGQVL